MFVFRFHVSDLTMNLARNTKQLFCFQGSCAECVDMDCFDRPVNVFTDNPHNLRKHIFLHTYCRYVFVMVVFLMHLPIRPV